MIKSGEIKKIARNKLNGNWTKAFSMSAIYTIVNIALSYILTLTNNYTANTPILRYSISIIIGLLAIPISFGLISAITKLIHNQKTDYTTPINDTLLNFSKSMGIFFRIILKMIIPAALIIVTSVGIVFLTSKVFQLSWDTLIGYILLIFFLYLVATILIAILALPYILSSYVLANESNLSSKDCINQSVILMDKNKFNFIKLIFSFIGWAFLIAFVVSIAKNFAPAIIGDLISYICNILFLPYIIASVAIFYDEANSVKIETIDINKSENNISES